MNILESSKILFVCFIWGNNESYVKEGIKLFQTLKDLGGELSNAKKIIYVTELIDPNSSKILSKLGVKTKLIKDFSNKTPYMNKPQNLKQVLDEDFDLLIMLDTDIVITGDFSSLINKTKMASRQDLIDPLGLDNWRKLFEYFKLEFPTELHSCSYSDELTVSYFNSAVLFIPKQYVNKLYESWQYYFDQIIDSSSNVSKIIKNLYYADQIALTFAYYSTKIPHHFISNEINFSTHVGTHEKNKNSTPSQKKYREIISKISPYLIHHHHRLTKSGLVRHSYFNNINDIIDKVNLCLKYNDENIKKEIKNLNDPELLVDELYLEILQRSADNARLAYFSKEIVEKRMSVKEIRMELENSEECKNLQKMDNNKSENINQKNINLKNEARTIVDEIYFEILERSSDEKGLEHYALMLQNGKMTTRQIKEELMKSEEYTILKKISSGEINLKDETKKSVDEIYREILRRPADTYGMYYWGKLLQERKISLKKMKKEFYNSEEYNMYIKKKD